MKTQLVTIDINKLDVDQLKQLECITYGNGDMETTKKIYLRRAFIEGYMSPENEKDYLKKYCL